ncbi:MAG: hypothetical protein ACRYFE_08910 [Janthinobacterium lividum]
MDYWPWGLLTPNTDRWTLRGQTINGGTSLAGSGRLARADGGGMWVGEQTFLLSGRDAIKAARAVEACLDGGVGRIVAWSFEAPFAPAGLAQTNVPHSDGAPFGDGSDYLSSPAGAVTAASAALRATRIEVTMLAGHLQAGEHFSIRHPLKGIRRYRVARVFGNEIDIRPPLREAVPAGTELFFLRVGCVCRLANPDDFMEALSADVGRTIVQAKAQWVEAF